MNKSITKKIDKRLANEGRKKENQGLRKDSNVKKMKTKPVEQYKGGVPKKMKRFVNNATIPFRMRASMTDSMKFRQELNHDKERPLPKDKKAPELKKLDSEKFVRVGNNLFRNEESVLDQAERLTHSRIIRRDISKEIDGLKFGQDREIADILKAGHLAEKKAIADQQKSFMSEFTGPTKTLIEIPEVKQELTQQQEIRRRRRLMRRDKKMSKLDRLAKRMEKDKLKELAKKGELGRLFKESIKDVLDISKGLTTADPRGREGFLPGPREQAMRKMKEAGGLVSSEAGIGL
jgi:hypothetical protein